MHTRNAALVVVVAAVVAGITGCPKKDDDDKPPPPPATVTAPAPPPTPAQVMPEGPDGGTTAPANPAIPARVKTELDNRPDGAAGSAVAVTGATASVQAPTGWAQTKGAVTLATSPDKAAQMGITSGGSAKLTDALAAMGVSGCQWNPPESVTVGPTKLASSAADGLCTQNGAQVHAAWVAPSAEQLLVVGAWGMANDGNAVFGSMRSIAKAGGGGGGGDIGACCAALRQNSKSAPPDQQGALIAAAGACEALKSNPNARQMLGSIRGMLAAANVPSSCR